MNTTQLCSNHMQFQNIHLTHLTTFRTQWYITGYEASDVKQ